MIALHPVFHLFHMSALSGSRRPHPTGLLGAQGAGFDF